MAVTITNNIGQAGLRFTTTITAGYMARVISGNARIGADGLIIDVLPMGVSDIVVRDPSGDTRLAIYGVEQVTSFDTATAIAGKGLSDAAAKTVVANAATTYTGLNTIGVAR